ncbi:MAG: NAD(P)/FAD-dependent oxidoreductase [Leptospiraceae bacterium]|nr:NAD(P)/FAD-dependent oxidoreductase [Leptospiraceae bacterium]
MIQEIELRLAPEISQVPEKLLEFISNKLNIPSKKINHIEPIQRSIDARSKHVVYQEKFRVYIEEEFKPKLAGSYLPNFPNASNSRQVAIIGAGPAGMFAALQLLELGIKPVIFERGKNVRERVFDLRAINLHNIVNEDSNYCFGEGGAGTYSDGKLYTRSTKRGNVRKVYELLVAFGAPDGILIDAHPHIGTNKLPEILKNMRDCILAHGGEIHFNTRLVDIELVSHSIKSLTFKDGSKFNTDKVILATGHSARDIFYLLHRKQIKIEAKPIAIGVRVEHPQALIDSIQYKCETRSKYLPPSPYSIVKQINGRGVYSFCMCPGGVIAPCATSQEEIVTNGWSSSQRSRPTANSGIVVELRLEDLKDFQKFGPLSVLEFQKSIEHRAWLQAGKTQKAPAQRYLDFIEGKQSKDLPKTSYPPGLSSIELASVLPKLIYQSLQKGFVEFGKSMQGYATNEAVIHAPETRTSSPIQIPRNKESLEHIEIKGLFPCGEGAGYAGGIVSAAMDGMRVASALVRFMT